MNCISKGLHCYCPSVGEPLTSGVQEWCYNVVGRKKCLLLDTWSQTGKASWFCHKHTLQLLKGTLINYVKTHVRLYINEVEYIDV